MWIECMYIRRYLCTINKSKCKFYFLKNEQYALEVIYYGIPLPKEAPIRHEYYPRSGDKYTLCYYAESFTHRVTAWLLQSGYYLTVNYASGYLEKLIETDKLELLQLLYSRGIRVHEPFYRTKPGESVNIYYPKCTLRMIQWFGTINIPYNYNSNSAASLCVRLLACNGYLDELKEKYIHIVNADTMVASVCSGNVKIVKWLYSLGIDPSRAYRNSHWMVYTHVRTLKWYLRVKGKKVHSTPLIKNGNLRVLKWACKSKRYTPNTKTLILCGSSKNGACKLDMLKWLLDEYDYSVESLFEMIQHSRDLQIVNYLKKHIVLSLDLDTKMK